MCWVRCLASGSSGGGPSSGSFATMKANIPKVTWLHVCTEREWFAMEGKRGNQGMPASLSSDGNR